MANEDTAMEHLGRYVCAGLILLCGCQNDISGAYLYSSSSTVGYLQVVRTPDNRLTGQFAVTTVKPDGTIDRRSAPITGAVDGENVSLTATGFFGLQAATLSGTSTRDALTLTGSQAQFVVLKRSSLADYQAQIDELNGRSQAILAARAASASRQRAEQRQRDFVARVDQLVGRMQRFNSEAEVHLGRFAGIEGGYHAITAKVSGYVEQERHLAADKNAEATRSQLSVAAIQASLETDQVHYQGQALESSLNSVAKPLAEEAAKRESTCQAPGSSPVDMDQGAEESAACARLSSALPAFREKYSAMTAGVAHLEQVYVREKNAQRALLQTAEKLQ